MAVLPSRPGSACFGRERLAVERRHAPGELAALPADPEAAGTTASDGTPLWRRLASGPMVSLNRGGPSPATRPCREASRAGGFSWSAGDFYAHRVVGSAPVADDS